MTAEQTAISAFANHASNDLTNLQAIPPGKECQVNRNTAEKGREIKKGLERSPTFPIGQVPEARADEQPHESRNEPATVVMTTYCGGMKVMVKVECSQVVFGEFVFGGHDCIAC